MTSRWQQRETGEADPLLPPSGCLDFCIRQTRVLKLTHLRGLSEGKGRVLDVKGKNVGRGRDMTK